MSYLYYTLRFVVLIKLITLKSHEARVCVFFACCCGCCGCDEFDSFVVFADLFVVVEEVRRNVDLPVSTRGRVDRIGSFSLLLRFDESIFVAVVGLQMLLLAMPSGCFLIVGVAVDFNFVLLLLLEVLSVVDLIGIELLFRLDSTVDFITQK
ncbi:hypothetical protein BDC45DRAFT_512663 [Circinella umbellata]|nr:hypothetical protein BDC45DRAFT_512663 [Circinella umbellata]